MTLTRLIQFSLFATLCFSTNSWADDVAGSQDDAEIGRFAGSSIIFYQKKPFDAFTFALAPVKYNFDLKKNEIDKKLEVKGELTRIGYEGPAKASAIEVLENYRGLLEGNGYKVIYEAAGDDIGSDAGGWFAKVTGEVDQLFEYSNSAAHYMVAERDKDGVKTDIGLYVTEYDIGTKGKTDIVKGQAIIDLNIVRAGALKSKMVTVSSSEIKKGIVEQGHIAIYGIYFDTDKSDLKTESKTSLDQVAQYLKDNPDIKIHVVGHTDNVGEMAHNLKLSNDRAGAVVAALEKDYAVPAERLNPAGVGPLAPIASNETDEGRAKNRRVELIPQ